MSTTRPVPKTARTAYTLLVANAQQAVEELGAQVCEDLALPLDGSWKIDWAKGHLIGPDVPAAPAAEAPEPLAPPE